MKTYSNEEQFVNTFAKDCKQGVKESGKFEAEFNGVAITVTSMDNNNSSKVTVYSGTVNGVEFSGSITALKKKLNITYTKEYNRTGERAQAANTKVVIKTEEELKETAKTAANRIKQAVDTLTKYGQKYGLCMEQLTMGEWSYDTPSGQKLNVTVEQYILACLFEQRSNAIKAQERKEAEKKAEAERKEAERTELLAKIQEASANGNFDLVLRLSADLKALK